MRTTARMICLIISLPLLLPQTVRAYAYKAHSKIVERAIDAMLSQSSASPLAPSKPTTATQADFDLYLLAVKNAPGILESLRTGLPNQLQAEGLSPFPSDGRPNEPYPFFITFPQEPDPANPGQTISVPHPPPCAIDQQDNLDELDQFRISEFSYYPGRTASSNGGCGLKYVTTVSEKTKVLGKVLGWHAGTIDDHVNDSVMWFKPTNALYFSVVNDLATTGTNILIGAMIAQVYCLVELLQGNICDPDDIFALADQLNPVKHVLGLIPGVGDWRSSDFTGLWHFIHVDRKGDGNHNDIPGMHQTEAGPRTSLGGLLPEPGAFDLALMGMEEIAGVSLNAWEADGDDFYGDYDENSRGYEDAWMPYAIPHLEFSSLDNLAQYGWDKYKDAGGTSALGLGWVLHAIGDAAAPHHVIGTSAYGHVPYESAVDSDLVRFFPEANPELNDQMSRVLTDGYSWWKLLQGTNGDVGGFIQLLAQTTRDKVRAHGDWAYRDDLSNMYHVDGDEAAAAGVYLLGSFDRMQRLTELSTSAAIGFLVHAASLVTYSSAPSPKCPGGDVYKIGQGCVSATPTQCSSGLPFCVVPTDCLNGQTLCQNSCCYYELE